MKISYRSGIGRLELIRHMGHIGVKQSKLIVNQTYVAPALVDTEGNRNRSRGFVGSMAGEAGAAATPLAARFGKPEENAPVIVFLASEDAAWLTGERMSASGGLN